MGKTTTIIGGLLSAALAVATPLRSGAINFRGPFAVSYDSVHNIHVDFADDFEGHLKIVHGSCSPSSVDEYHHEVGTVYVRRDARPERFVWIIPEDAMHEGCLHAYSNGILVGRSASISVSHPVTKRQVISEVADMTGPWFDGVAALASKNQTEVFVSEAKSKSIGIIGGGMAGILTALLLDSVNMTNWHITESSGRIGGRIRTKYLAGTTPDEYQYQEMGPMRFPVSITYSDTNETLDIQDHKMVFQLADYLNQLNGNDSELAVNFIPWIQSSPNVPAASRGYRKPDGTIPSRAELTYLTSVLPPTQNISDMEAVATAREGVEELNYATNEWLRNASTNLYKAHKQAIKDGYFHWSEANYLRYELGMSADVVDYVAGASALSPIWEYDSVYFSATSWRTIDKGLEALPRAALPLVKDRLTLDRTVQGLSYDETTGKVSVNWRSDPYSIEPESEEYDYAVVAVPFSKVRAWRLPTYSSLLTRAITTMNYQQSCKMALHFKTRFWEAQDPPIIGGCGSVDIYGIGSVCYPAYEINSTRPGVILASYTSGTPARSMAALTDEEHVSLVYRAMAEVHGADIIADQYTGFYDRQCWETDVHQAGAWAAPFVGQQELYMPAYYETEHNTIFVGEHTSITHAWIFSALDSAVRGTVQLLLELGLVDEAKQITEEWMGRWIRV